MTNTQIAEQEIAEMMFDSNFHHLLQQMERRSSTISPVNERYVALLAMREHIIGFNYWSTFLDMMGSEIQRHCYAFRICVTDEENDDWLGKEYDGYLLLGNISADKYRQIRDRRKPMVWVDGPEEHEDCSCVGVDNRSGAFQAAETAIRMGHRHLAFLQNQPHRSYNERQEGFMSCVEAYRHFGVVHDTVNATEDVRERIVSLLTSKDRPTYIQACSDNLLLHIYTIAEQLMLHIPKDLSLAGFDNIREGRLQTPALTTVDVPRIDIAVAAVELLIKHIQTPSTPNETILLKPELLLRGSLTAPPQTVSPGCAAP